MTLRLDRVTAAAVVAAIAMLYALAFAAGAVVAQMKRPPAAVAVVNIRVPPPVIIELGPTPLPAPATVDALIRSAALQHGLPPTLVSAVAQVESDFDPREVSAKGARGLMQVMPATGERFGVAADRLFEPAPNIAAGTAYLAWLLDRYRGDLDLALAAYNAGEGAVDRYRGIPPYRETQTYVRRVRAALEKIR